MPRKEDDNRVPRTPDAGSTLPWIEGVSRPWTIGRVDFPDVPNGALADVARFVDDIEEVTAEHKALDWNSLATKFPMYGKDTNYPRPTLTEFVDLAKAGAAQLHANDYLVARAAQIAEVEALDPDSDEYQDFMGGRAINKDVLLGALRGRFENETIALSTIKVTVPIKGTTSMENRGLYEGRASVPASFFTELATARAIYLGSDLQVTGNYTLPPIGHEKNQLILAPIDTILIPNQPKPAAA